MNKLKKPARWGFTLIELLATLTIMAVIAAILFPFVTNYTKKANHDTSLRSLRILQDAMDRYRAVNTDFSGWPIGTGDGGTTLSSYKLLQSTAGEAGQIISDISAAGTNQTLRLPTDGITTDNVFFVSTAADAATSGWEVLWYRRNANVSGVNRKGVDQTNWSAAAAAADIDTAFQ